MRTKTLPILCILMLLFCLTPASAAAPDLTQDCSLTLTYQQGGTSFPGMDISIYRVASAQANGSFSLLPAFEDSAADIHSVSSQQEWREIADTLTSHIAANRIAATRTETTRNPDGIAVFSQLEAGLYLVEQAIGESESGSYLFERFMVYLPTPTSNGYQYDVTAQPKSSLLPDRKDYTVLKLWRDSNRNSRPASVTVDILKDGILQETVTLSTENNWTYTWSAADSRSVWTVSERNVPSGYQASISQRETTFIITNTKTSAPPPGTPDIPDSPGTPSEPDVPVDPMDPNPPYSPPPDDPNLPITPDTPHPDVPQTGDTFPMGFYVTAMCVSGLILMILGIGSRRSNRHETTR